jgi:MEDS: MEthanogen/methylotroph, DcmR Sensory domain
MTQNKAGSAAGHFHAVRFYNDADRLCRIVADFLVEGFALGQPGIIIATPAHRDGIDQHLTDSGFDVTALRNEGRLVSLDAADTLAHIMVNGMPDPVEFRRAVIPFIVEATHGQRDCVVRLYGEMVDVLWKADQTAAATRLETLWNTLANTHKFSLLCSYAVGNFYKNAAIQEISSLHTHVASDTDEATLTH